MCKSNHLITGTCWYHGVDPKGESSTHGDLAIDGGTWRLGEYHFTVGQTDQSGPSEQFMVMASCPVRPETETGLPSSHCLPAGDSGLGSHASSPGSGHRNGCQKWLACVWSAWVGPRWSSGLVRVKGQHTQLSTIVVLEGLLNARWVHSPVLSSWGSLKDCLLCDPKHWMAFHYSVE